MATASSRPPLGNNKADPLPNLCPVVLQADYDPIFSCDPRIMEDLLTQQEYYQPDPNYCPNVQSQMEYRMRAIVADWMYHVCHDHPTDPDVFLLTMQLFDRFLSKHDLAINQLQLLASACLFIASKLLEFNPVSLQKVILSTDNSISQSDLLVMELFVCQILDYNISGVTAFDVLIPLLKRLQLESILSAHSVALIRRHARHLINKFTIDTISLRFSPTVLSAAAVLEIFHLKLEMAASDEQRLTSKISEILNVNMDAVHNCRIYLSHILYPKHPTSTDIDDKQSDSEQVTPNNIRDIDI